MSRPFYKVTCTECGFNDGYSYGIHYVYEGPSDHEPVFQAAWCSNCDKIVNACIPFSRARAEGEIHDLKMWIERNKRGLFAKFSKIKKHEVDKAAQEMKTIYKRLKYFETIRYKPRCIRCGGHTVFPFDLPYGEFNEVENLNIQHSCGGTLVISMEGRFSFKSRPKVVYNETGTILQDERKQ